MLAALAVDWGFLLLRAVIAAVFGIAALMWPGVITSRTVVLLFGAYALSDGVLALIVALDMKDAPGFGSLLFDAMVRMCAGVFAFAAPALAALAMVNLLAAWTVLNGVAALWAAIVLGRELAGEWPLPTAGVVSILFGVMLKMGPGAPPELQWVFGPYALFLAMTLLVLTQRLRQLADEIVDS